MKRYRGKKRLATMEKRAWQKKFLKEQEAILSQYAYDMYKQYGSGMVLIRLNDCIDLIIPSLNIPELNYVYKKTDAPRSKEAAPLFEAMSGYDPKKQYFIGFQTYQADPAFVGTWTRDLKLLSKEEFEKEYALGLGMIEVATSDEPIDRYEKHGEVIEKLKFDDPKKH